MNYQTVSVFGSHWIDTNDLVLLTLAIILDELVKS